MESLDYTKIIPKPCFEYMIVNILDHCNLRCRGCDHFACIADEYFVPFDSIDKDLSRLSMILEGDYINSIGVMGGEPLLHPELKKILVKVRDSFPYSQIRLTTNGLLLLSQDDEFWEVCRDNHVTIINTKYPINIKYESIAEKAESMSVKFLYFEGTEDGNKCSFKRNIDENGLSDPVKNFLKCDLANYGNFLFEGRLYSCPFSCQSFRIYNSKFKRNLRQSKDDFLDIYNIKTKEELFRFAATPKYYCRYCGKGCTDYKPWGRTKGDIYEWLAI